MAEILGRPIAGAPMTLLLTFGALLGGILTGIPISMARQSRQKLLRTGAGALIISVRAIPPLVWLFLIYFGLGSGILRLSPFVAALIGLALITAVNMAEIYRESLAAIHSGQWEASQALGRRSGRVWSRSSGRRWRGFRCPRWPPVALDPAGLVQAVVAGQIDMTVGNWYRTAKRAEVVNLTAPLYLDQMGIISKDGISKAADAEGRSIGNIQGYLWTDDLQAVFNDAPKLYPNTVAMAQDLSAGRIEVGFESYTVVKEAMKAGAYAGLEVKVIEPDERIAASMEPGQSTFPTPRGTTR